MKIISVAGSDVFSNPHKVEAKKIFESPHATVIHMALNPGESLKSHVTPVDVFFYILEGNPTIEIGDEKEKVSADSIIESPADIPHCVYNETDTLARFLVVKLSGSK
jgi:quercetin dioxygenase-like cupin family protein